MSEEKRILVVDDDSLICKMIKRCIDFCFSGKDIKVSYVLGAQEGLSNLERYPEKYDLVITDWNCPEKGSGMGIIDCAKFSFGIPVIVYTGDVLSAKLYLDSNEICFHCPVIDKSEDISKLMGEIDGILYR
jgi:DNA-binding NtrC family response regulator